jgi:GTP-binding protein
MFIDEAKINIKAGDGGNGLVSFFLLKGSYKKVANGGNGGSGGNIVFAPSRSVNTLLGFKKKIHFKAENGQAGMPNNRNGRRGEDLVIYVPVGTVVKEDGSIIADLSEEGENFVAAIGGSGGRGNANFVSQMRRFPGFAEKGEKIEEKWISLELRLLADAALVGFPNAGKSTIISAISAARPKIAPYPFTTLSPNLGVVSHGDDSFVVADIPGIIEGAHKGTGLGDRFLRHILRAKLLVIVLDASLLLEAEMEGLMGTFNTIRQELKLYNELLSKKDYITVINKADLFVKEEICKNAANYISKKTGGPVLVISAVTGRGLDELIKVLHEKIIAIRKEEYYLSEASKTSLQVSRTYSLATFKKDTGADLDKLEIIKDSGEFKIKNKKLEKMVAMTDLENNEALEYLKYRLKKMKIGDRLKKMGIEEGSTVIIGNLVFELME